MTQIPDQAGLMLMTFVSDVLDEVPGLDKGEVVQLWNAYVASHTAAAGNAASGSSEGETDA